MEITRQEYWSGLTLPTPGDLPNLGIEPRSPGLQAVSLPSEPPGKPLDLLVLLFSVLQIIIFVILSLFISFSFLLAYFPSFPFGMLY